MDDTSSSKLTEVIGRFSDAEKALRTLIESAEKLSTVRQELEKAETSFDTSQKALVDVASGIYGLTREMKDVARDMKDCAIAMRSLNPEHLETRLAGLAASQHRLGNRVWIVGALFAAAVVLALLLGRS